jgi:hypothetical protein
MFNLLMFALAEYFRATAYRAREKVYWIYQADST